MSRQLVSKKSGRHAGSRDRIEGGPDRLACDFLLVQESAQVPVHPQACGGAVALNAVCFPGNGRLDEQAVLIRFLVLKRGGQQIVIRKVPPTVKRGH